MSVKGSKLNMERVRESGDESVARDDFTQSDDPLSNRRSIRSYYREIENLINEEKYELAHGDSDKFMHIMNQVESMHQHVKKPREQVADAVALLGLADTFLASVKTHTNGVVTPAEFVSCLIRQFGHQRSTKGLSGDAPNIFWKKIGVLVSPIFMKGPGCMSMIGPMKNEVNQRKLVVRSKRSRARARASARPKKLENAVEVVTDTDRNIHVMFEMLKKEKKVKLENLVLNRNSFAQTVENLFALSFLVKDGRVLMDADEYGNEFVVPSNGPSAQEIKTGAAKSHQFIFRFDFDDWKLMKTIVPAEKELMPDRYAVFAEAKVEKELMPDRNAVFAEAKVEPDCKSFSYADPIPTDSHFTDIAPVKKFSRNYGHVLQFSDLTETDEGMIKSWNCKRKRKLF